MWVAGPYRRTPHLGPFVSSSEGSLHQPERASSSSVRPVGLRTPVSRPVGHSVLRQHHHGSVCSSPAAIHHGLVQCQSERSQSPHMVIGPERTLHQDIVDQLVRSKSAQRMIACFVLGAIRLTAELPCFSRCDSPQTAPDPAAKRERMLFALWHLAYDALQVYAFPPGIVVSKEKFPFP